MTNNLDIQSTTNKNNFYNSLTSTKTSTTDRSFKSTVSVVHSTIISPRATAAAKTKIEKKPLFKKLTTQIYDWENEKKHERQLIQIDMNEYVPTAKLGVYVRKDMAVALNEQNKEEQPDKNQELIQSLWGNTTRSNSIPLSMNPENWIDLQIVLSQDEMNTLAQRKKALHRVKNQRLYVTCGQTSIQASTPYVEPRKIIHETYRPDQPHKWVQLSYHNR